MPSAGVVGIGVLLLTLCTPSTGVAAPPPGGAPRPGLFAGYSYTRAGEADLHGWHVDGTFSLGASLQLVADLSGHYGSFAQADLTELTVMAGRPGRVPGSRHAG